MSNLAFAQTVFICVPDGHDEHVTRTLKANEEISADTHLAFCLNVNGKRSGPEKVYARTKGKGFYLFAKCHRANDVRQGPAEQYYEDGTTVHVRFNYKDDKRDGLCTYFSKEGEIQSIHLFKQGEEDHDFTTRYEQEYLTLEFAENATLAEKNAQKTALATKLIP